jgi:putative Mg2+ transporter-C (MgtC) family protein
MVFEIGPVELELVFKLVLAAVLGMLIGVERKIHRKPAGMRTHSLVCVGATLFTVISLYITGSNVDVSRIAAGVVTGVGFLAAGIIFKSEDRVLGLTTAAEIWVMAAIGVAVGAGYYLAAVVTAIIVLIILVPLKYVEREAKNVLE